MQVVKKILSRLFRVFVHVYIHHFDRIAQMGSEAHVNTCYKHFYYFVKEFGLIDTKELEPLVSGRGQGGRGRKAGARKLGFVNSFISTLCRSLTAAAAFGSRAELSSQTGTIWLPELTKWPLRPFTELVTPALGMLLSIFFLILFIYF